MGVVLQQSEEENADEEFDFRPAGGGEEDQFMSRYYHVQPVHVKVSKDRNTKKQPAAWGKGGPQ